MKILLFGKNGQVGSELQRLLAPLGELIALDRQGDFGFCGDLFELSEIKRTIHKVKPDVIVNAAAYTAVDKAETDVELATQINSKAPEVLAREANVIGALLVHYSTDYVFDGSGISPWCETDNPSPLNHYGGTKLAGERAIQASGCNYFIFRTSWVHGIFGNNFVKTILRLASEKKHLNIVADQVGAPTSAALIADITVRAMELFFQRPTVAGLYHLAPLGEVSWYEYAQFIVGNARQLGASIQTETIAPISSLDYITPAKRPYNSRLNTAKLSTTFSLPLPSWDVGVKEVIEKILRM